MAEFPPRMTEEESASAWQAYRAARDAGDVDGAITARNRIVEGNLRLVFLTMQIHPGLAKLYESRADGFQGGVLGLVAAVDSFDPARGKKFANWAITRIEWHLLGHREGVNTTGRRAWGIMRRESGLFYAEHGYEPNEAELLEITGLSPDHLRHGLAWGRSRRSRSLDAPLGEEGDSNSLAEEIACKSDGEPCDTVRQHEIEAFLRRALASLKPAQRKLLWLRFAAGWTLEALGKLCGVSRERIRQITATAVEKLRRRFGRAYNRWAGLRHATPAEATADLEGIP